MLEKTITSYGGEYRDRAPVEDPTSEMAASFGNRLLEDVAQGTRTLGRVFVSFVPTGTAAPVAVDVVDHYSIWGSGDTEKPTIEKTDVGTYEVTWPESLVDGTGDEETLALRHFHVQTFSSAASYALPPSVIERSANSVTVLAVDTSFVAADDTDLEFWIWGD